MAELQLPDINEKDAAFLKSSSWKVVLHSLYPLETQLEGEKFLKGSIVLVSAKALVSFKLSQATW